MALVGNYSSYLGSTAAAPKPKPMSPPVATGYTFPTVTNYGSPLPPNKVAGLYGPPASNSYLDGVPAAPAPPAPAAPSGPSGGGAPPSFSYDYSNDPVLQQIRALGQQSVQQARDAALAARQHLVVDYGDPALASSLGLDGSYGTAAQDNPYSTLARLQHAYDLAKGNTEHDYQLQTTDLGRQLADAQHQTDVSRQQQTQQHTLTLADLLNNAAKQNLIHGSAYGNQVGLENTNYGRGMSELARALAETTQQNQLAQSEATRGEQQALGEGSYGYQGQVYDANQAAQQQLAAITQALLGAQNQAAAQNAQAEQDAAQRAIQFALQYGTPA